MPDETVTNRPEADEQDKMSSSDECCGDRKHKHKHHKHGNHTRSVDTLGPIWFIGWLFTLGYLQIPFFWKGVLAIIIWPYYLGQFLSLR